MAGGSAAAARAALHRSGEGQVRDHTGTVRRASLRPRFRGGAELALALPPTSVVLLVFFLVEIFSQQRLLFASLASSAFLIYLDPRHVANRVRTLIIAQTAGALLGCAAYSVLGSSYPAAAAAMVSVILVMVLLDAMHPPAVSTALGFAFRSGPTSNLALFGLATGLLVVLVALQRISVWTLARLDPSEREPGAARP